MNRLTFALLILATSLSIMSIAGSVSLTSSALSQSAIPNAVESTELAILPKSVARILNGFFYPAANVLTTKWIWRTSTGELWLFTSSDILGPDANIRKASISEFVTTDEPVILPNLPPLSSIVNSATLKSIDSHGASFIKLASVMDSQDLDWTDSQLHLVSGILFEMMIAAQSGRFSAETTGTTISTAIDYVMTSEALISMKYLKEAAFDTIDLSELLLDATAISELPPETFTVIGAVANTAELINLGSDSPYRWSQMRNSDGASLDQWKQLIMLIDRHHIKDAHMSMSLIQQACENMVQNRIGVAVTDELGFTDVRANVDAISSQPINEFLLERTGTQTNSNPFRDVRASLWLLCKIWSGRHFIHPVDIPLLGKDIAQFVAKLHNKVIKLSGVSLDQNHPLWNTPIIASSMEPQVRKQLSSLVDGCAYQVNSSLQNCADNHKLFLTIERIIATNFTMIEDMAIVVDTLLDDDGIRAAGESQQHVVVRLALDMAMVWWFTWLESMIITESRQTLSTADELQSIRSMVASIDKKLPRHFQCSTWLNQIPTLIGESNDVSTKAAWSCLMRFRGLLLEEYIFASLSMHNVALSPDISLRSSISRMMPNHSTRLNNVNVNLPTVDYITWHHDGVDFCPYITELMWVSNGPHQTKQMAHRYTMIQEALVSKGIPISMHVSIVAVDNTAESWQSALRTTEMHHSLQVHNIAIDESDLNRIIKLTKKLSIMMHGMLPASMQQGVASAISKAHEGNMANFDPTSIAVDEQQLSAKLSSMKQRQRIMYNNGILPVHIDEFGPNDDNLEDIIRCQGVFSDELRTVVDESDNAFLKAVTDQLHVYIDKGHVAVCTNKTPFLVERAWFATKDQELISSTHVLLTTCDCGRHRSLVQELKSSKPSATVMPGTPWMRMCYVTNMTMTDSSSGSEMADKIWFEATRNPMSADFAHSQKDILFRYPSFPINKPGEFLFDKLVKFSEVQCMNAIEDFRKAYAQSAISTKVANITRQLQNFSSHKSGLPVSVLDPGHGRLLIKQPDLHRVTLLLEAGNTKEVNATMLESGKTYHLSDSKLSKDEYNDLFAQLAKHSNYKSGEIKETIKYLRDSAGGNTLSIAPDKLQENVKLWSIMDVFTTAANKLTFMDKENIRMAIAARTKSSLNEFAGADASFPESSADIPWIYAEWEKLSSKVSLTQRKQLSKIQLNAKKFCSKPWIEEHFEEYMRQHSLTDATKHVRTAALHELCQRNGFLYACHIADMCSKIEDALSGKLGPAQIAWRKLEVSGCSMLLTMANRNNFKTTGCKVMLFGPPSWSSTLPDIGPTYTQRGKLSWQLSRCKTFSYSHCFFMDSRSIRQGVAAPAYLIDNVMSEFQLNNCIKIAADGKLILNPEASQFEPILGDQCSYWLTYILRNEKPLSEFIQNQRYALLTMIGQTWHVNAVGSKLSMRPKNSVHFAMIHKMCQTFKNKFGGMWRKSLISMGAGTTKLLELISNMNVSIEDISSSDEISGETGTWLTPRLTGSGNHESAASALRELFQAYQYDRDIAQYDTEMIKVANKIQEGAAKVQAKKESLDACDGKPWHVYGMRGYTRTPNDRDKIDSINVDSDTVSSVTVSEAINHYKFKSPKLDTKDEAMLAFMLQIGSIPLPGFSRRWLSVGSRLMRSAHPEGSSCTKNWHRHAELSLGPSSRSNTSSGITKIITKIDLDSAKKLTITNKLKEIQKAAAFDDEVELTDLMVEMGYDRGDVEPYVKEAIEHSDKSHEFESLHDTFEEFFDAVTESKGQCKLLTSIDNSQEVQFVMIKKVLIIMNSRLKAVDKSAKIPSSPLWQSAITALQSCLQTVADECDVVGWSLQIDAVLDAIQDNKRLNMSIREEVEPLTAFVQSNLPVMSEQWWANIRFCVRCLLSWGCLCDHIENHLDTRLKTMKTSDVTRLTGNSPMLAVDCVKELLGDWGNGGPISEYLAWGIGAFESPTTMLTSYFTTLHDGFMSTVEASHDPVKQFAYIGNILDFVDTGSARLVDQYSLMAIIPHRPLRFIAARSKLIGDSTSNRLPKSKRQKNAITIASGLIHRSIGGLSGSSSQLERSLLAAYSLQTYYFARAGKQQPGGTREIPVKDIVTNEATVLAEEIDGALTYTFKEDAIMHPKGKKMLQEELALHAATSWTSLSETARTVDTRSHVDNFNPVTKCVEQTNQIKTNQTKLGGCCLYDHAAWGPGHCTSSFTAATNPFNDHIGEGLMTAKRLIDEGLAQKDDELPQQVWSVFLRPDFEESKLPDHMKPIAQHFLTTGEIAVARPYDMGQGMRHKGSNVVGLAAGYSRRWVMRTIMGIQGFPLQLMDQQGSDDRGSGYTMDVNDVMVGSESFPNILPSFASWALHHMLPDLVANSSLWPAHTMQYGMESFSHMLDVVISRAGNHKLSPKSVPLVGLSEMNGRFINGKRVINPTIRDTAPICLGHAGGDLTTVLLDLFSRTKNGATLGASEATLIPLYFYQLSRIADQFMLNPGQQNALLIHGVTDLKEGPSNMITWFDLPLALGGPIAPTIDNLAFGQSYTMDLNKLQYLHQKQTRASTIILTCALGIKTAEFDKVEDAMNVVKNVRSLKGDTATGRCKIKSKFLRKGNRMSQVIDDLLEKCKLKVLSSNRSEDGIPVDIRNGVILTAPYMQAKLLVADLQRMRRILRSPGLTRGLDDIDFAHMMWLTKMCSRGHALLAPFTRDTFQTALQFAKSDNTNSVLASYMSQQMHKDYTDAVNVFAEKCETSKRYDMPDLSQPSRFSALESKPHLERQSVTFAQFLMMALVVGHHKMSTFAKQCAESNLNTSLSSIQAKLLNIPPVPAGPRSMFRIANQSRHTINKSPIYCKFPAWSDHSINTETRLEPLQNSPLIVALAICAPHIITYSRHQVKHPDSLEQDKEILLRESSKTVMRFEAVLQKAMSSSVDDEIEDDFAQVIMDLWNETDHLMSHQLMALLPTPHSWSPSKRISRSVARLICIGFEFSQEMETTSASDVLPTNFILQNLNVVEDGIKLLKEAFSAISAASGSVDEAMMTSAQYAAVLANKFDADSLNIKTAMFSDAFKTHVKKCMSKQLKNDYAGLMFLFNQPYDESHIKQQFNQSVQCLHFDSTRQAGAENQLFSAQQFNAVLTADNSSMIACRYENHTAIHLVNASKPTLTLMLKELTKKIEDKYATSDYGSRSFNQTIFDRIEEDDYIGWYSVDLTKMLFGRGKRGQWKLNVVSSITTRQVMPWSSKQGLASNVQLKVATNPIRIIAQTANAKIIEKSTVSAVSDVENDVMDKMALVLKRKIEETHDPEVANELRRSLRQIESNLNKERHSKTITYPIVSPSGQTCAHVYNTLGVTLPTAVTEKMWSAYEMTKMQHDLDDIYQGTAAKTLLLEGLTKEYNHFIKDDIYARKHLRSIQMQPPTGADMMFRLPSVVNDCRTFHARQQDLMYESDETHNWITVKQRDARNANTHHSYLMTMFDCINDVTQTRQEMSSVALLTGGTMTISMASRMAFKQLYESIQERTSDADPMHIVDFMIGRELMAVTSPDFDNIQHTADTPVDIMSTTIHAMESDPSRKIDIGMLANQLNSSLPMSMVANIIAMKGKLDTVDALSTMLVTFYDMEHDVPTDDDMFGNIEFETWASDSSSELSDVDSTALSCLKHRMITVATAMICAETQSASPNLINNGESVTLTLNDESSLIISTKPNQLSILRTVEDSTSSKKVPVSIVASSLAPIPPRIVTLATMDTGVHMKLLKDKIKRLFS